MGRIRWTDEMIIEASKEYAGKTVDDFRNGNPRAYARAKERGLMSMMTWLVRQRCACVKCEVMEESKKYAGKGTTYFRRHSPRAYECAQSHGWIKEMTWLGEANHHYWTFDELVQASLPYTGKGRTAFARGNSKAYSFAKRMEWLDKLPWLGVKNDPYTDPVWNVYVYRFRKAVYVGLTCDIAIRAWEHRTGHKKRSAVFKYHKATGEPIPEMEVIARGLTKEKARALEDETVSKYRNDPEVTVLNKARTGIHSGSTGSVSYIWTKPRIIELAKTCTCRSDMKKKASAAYHKARRLGMLDMLFPKKENNDDQRN